MQNNSPLVLVTGGAKRVGAEIVRTLARNGARVIIHYGTSQREAEQLLSEIGGSANGHSCVQYDLENPEGIPDFVKTLPQDLSAVVNNASVFLRVTAEKETPELAKRQYDVNFYSPFALLKAFYEHSVLPEISVVNMLDQAITSTPAESCSYILSKKMLAEATKLAARQFAPRMRVNGICPGPVFPPVGLEHLKMAKTLSTLPLARPVDASDLAEAVRMLLFNRSMTGSILNVDCGQSLL